MRATRGPRVPKPADRAGASTSAASVESERWIDEGPIRDAAVAATTRAQSTSVPRRGRTPGQLDPDVVAEVEREAGAARSGRYRERITSAAEALQRGRYDDARRMLQPVLRDLPNVAAAHEIAGHALYSLGQWRKAAVELELARQLDHSVRHHAVLADCYRALKRHRDVEALWDDLREESPSADLVAEGRIVMAGSLADQGKLAEAVRLLEKTTRPPKRPQVHHLRSAYALADLYERAGDAARARELFRWVATHEPDFVDAAERASSLG